MRTDRSFLPAALALGDACETLGDHREALRVWERAAEVAPALPLLARLERAYRQDGRPSRMIALYREAIDRAPDVRPAAIASPHSPAVQAVRSVWRELQAREQHMLEEINLADLVRRTHQTSALSYQI